MKDKGGMIREGGGGSKKKRKKGTEIEGSGGIYYNVKGNYQTKKLFQNVAAHLK